MDLPRILVLGGTGQVGWELSRALAPLGELVVASRSGMGGPKADISDLAGIRDLLNAVRPQLIVNAAAYTAVDKAESEPELAMRVNGEAPGVIGEWAAGNGARVIHYSTDYVFDGTKDGAYVETDRPCPLNVYGHTKLAGEQALLSTNDDALILRVSWVYGARGQNFLKAMQRLMQERDELRIVADHVGTPTWSRLIAGSTALIAHQSMAVAEQQALGGIYHMAPQGQASWFDFATAIRDAAGYRCNLKPIATSEYPTDAKRPLNSLLNSDKLARDFAIGLPAWKHSLELCLTGQAG